MGAHNKARIMAAFETDLTNLQGFPPAERWFVHDTADADFLRAQLALVFDKPETPEASGVHFLHACLACHRAAR